MRRFALFLPILFAHWALAQAVPAPVRGTWRIAKILSTSNPACWDEARARTLIGTTLRYDADRMTWSGSAPVDVSEALSRTLSRRKFQDEYKVDLPELGIAAPSVTEIDLQHEDADITGASTEVPGDTVVLVTPNRIVVSACGVFYSATRVPGRR